MLKQSKKSRRGRCPKYPAEKLDVVAQFPHDQLHEIYYSDIDEETRKNYLAITRSLACEKIAADNSEQIYSIVDQYIKCIDLIKKK